MSIKNCIDELLSFNLDKKHNFSLIEDSKITSIPQENMQKNISNSLNDNITLFSKIYSQKINSDIVIRNFLLNAKGKQYNASLIFIDGMVDSEIINRFVLTPLMHKNQTNIGNFQNSFISQKQGLNYRTNKKINLEQSILESLVSQNSITTENETSKILDKINNGFTALFVDTLSVCFCIEAKGFKTRSISKPENEIVVRGSQEAFVENIRTNTSIIRRIINNNKVKQLWSTKIKYQKIYQEYSQYLFWLRTPKATSDNIG